MNQAGKLKFYLKELVTAIFVNGKSRKGCEPTTWAVTVTRKFSANVATTRKQRNVAKNAN